MKKRVNYIKVNLNKKNSQLNKNSTNVSTYIRVKEKYNSYLVRNKNIQFLKENSTLMEITSKDYLERRKKNNKEKEKNISSLPFIPKQKFNSKKKEEIKNLQRNAVSMRRLEYSMKVKDVIITKRFKFNKYNIKKVITIQKWVKGYLLRSFLSNVCECEQIMNDFINHINKYIFIKLNIFGILKNIKNKKNINDNICFGRKLSECNKDNISISIINTNNNTNTFTNNNTFSICQDTPDKFEIGNRKLKIIQNRNYNSLSIRDLQMVNCNKSKKNNNLNNINEINNLNKLSLQNSKNFKRAKSLNDIKNINQHQIIYSSLRSNFKNKIPIQIKEMKQNNKISIKTRNLRSLLFNNNTKLDKPLNKYYQKPINNIMFITKISYYNNNNINLGKENNNDIENENNEDYNGIERKENGIFSLENIIIEEIKEAKEDEEEDSQSQIEFMKNSSFLDSGNIDSSLEAQNGIKAFESQSEKLNNIFKIDKDKTYNISSISFQIKSNYYDKGKIFLILLLYRQIKFIIKPYVFNLLKQNWIKKITSLNYNL